MLDIIPNLVRTVIVLMATTVSSIALGQVPTPWRAGFSRVDITPDEPVRMSGYGNRDHASEGVDTPLYVRAMALQHAEENTHLLLTVDTVGLSGAWTKEVVAAIQNQHGLARECVAVCCTHTHSGPYLDGELTNLFSVPLSDDEHAASDRYDKKLRAAMIVAAEQAISDLSPVSIGYGRGNVGFAANRRVIADGRWKSIGVQPDRPVDHSVPVLRIVDQNDKLRGIVFNYACHCTTIGGDHYKINADWAGYATAQLEMFNPDCVAMCTIGCGGDANPNPRGTVELAQLHGRALATEVAQVVAGPIKAIDQGIVANFGYAGLSFDLPSRQELSERLADKNVQARENAQHLLDSWNKHGRLPATYPVPIQTWAFGDQLTMVLLGGEVVVDYALRLKQELDAPDLWVSAYANDVLGYICSERMRAEGGYEYDRSAVYYNLPGPWAEGTEDLFIRRIREVLDSQGQPRALDPTAALESIHVAPGFEVQLVASEPLVIDPINLAFGADGKLWVVEMSDYPLGADDGQPAGRVKFLTDTDDDGVFDEATVFLEGVAFATGVWPWNDGVIVSAAPDIFFARDTDGDGRADERETWVTGFDLANPQHRINGFTYGLEHALHLASGDNLGELKSVVTGETVNASGRDVRIWPTSGKVDVLSGRTQYVRTRNDWGECFGNDNSRPMFHYPIEDRYLARNPAVRYSGNVQYMFDPPSAPPVFPRSNTADRFNDLFALNCFTSACSSIVFRSGALGPDFDGATFICEPVHNLVHSSQLLSSGSSYRAERRAEQTQSEFLASTDPWFRGVRAIEGTDGMLWIVDMYRHVIEHPEWIPESWQQQLDLRAGADRGRIYRVVPKGTTKEIQLPRFAAKSSGELASLLEHDCGAVADLAQQTLLNSDATASPIAKLAEIATSSQFPQARVHALWTLDTLGELQDEVLQQSLRAEYFGVVRAAIVLCEPRLRTDAKLLDDLEHCIDHSDPRVRLQLALTLGESADKHAGELLSRLVKHVHEDRWLSRAIVCSSALHASDVLADTLKQLSVNDGGQAAFLSLAADMLATAKNQKADVQSVIENALGSAPAEASWVVPIAIRWLDSQPLSKTTRDSPLRRELERVYATATAGLRSRDKNEAARIEAVDLLGRGFADQKHDVEMLAKLVSPRETVAIQTAAIERLAKVDRQANAELVVEKWSTLSQTVRDAAVSQLLSTRDATATLLAGIQTDRISARDLSPAVRQQLRNSNDESNRQLAVQLLGDSSNTNRNELVAKYLTADTKSANAERGAAVFAKHCAACHTVDASGRAAGPSLANLTDRSAQYLVESILDPNRAVDPQYRSYSVLLDDGRTLVGTIAEEVGDSLTLVHPDAKRTTIARSEIETMRNTGMSLMPEGMQDEIDPLAMADLIQYLQGNLQRTQQSQ